MPKGVFIRTEEHKRNISKGKMGHPGYFKGKEFSEEHKNNISLSLKGKKKTKEHLEKLSISMKEMWSDENSIFNTEEYRNKLKVPCSEEQKIKLSIKNKGINKGEKHGLWIGGDDWYWSRKLKKIYKDCCLCHRDYILEMHHKDHNRKNNARMNQIIICKTCHDFWHFSDRERDVNGRYLPQRM